MTDRIDVLVTARNQTSGALNQVKQDLSGLDNFASKLNAGLSGIGAIAGIGAVVAGLQQIGAEIDALGRRGAIFEQLDSVLNSYASKAGQVGEAFVEAGRRASAGTIGDYDLILNANRALQFEVASTSDQYAKLIELATALGRAQGISDTQSLEYLTTGIARESKMILDNLGLIIDLDKATSDFATTIGKSAGELTTAERKQAILNEAFRQGATAIEANRAAGESAATQYERLDAKTQNLKDVFGQLIAQNSAAYIKLLADQLQYATDVLEGETKLPSWMESIAGVMQDAGEGMEGTTIQTLVLKQALLGLAGGVQAYNSEIGKSATREASNDFDVMEGAVANAGTALIMTRDAAQAASMEAERLGIAALDGADGLSTLESMAWSTATSLDAVAQAMGRASAVQGRLGAVRQGAINQAQNLALRAVQSGADPAQVTAMYGELVDKLSNVALNWDATNEATLENKLALEGVSSEYDGILETIIETDKEADRAAKRGVKEMEKAAREAEKAFDDLKGKVAGVLQEALDPGVGVDVNTLLKDGVNLKGPDGKDRQPTPEELLLPREDAINENARRLADVAVKGFESPWYEYFRNQFPALFQEFFAGAADNNGVRQQAATLLQNFQDGLEPELLDKDKAKERVKRLLLGEQSMAQLAQEIAAELSAEFGGSISLGKIQATANSALGVDGGNQVQLAQSLSGIATEAGGQAAVIGGNIRSSIVSALDGIGETVAMALDKQFRAENNLKVVTEAGRANGEAWGSGFLSTMDNLTSQVLEKLAGLVSPYVEATQARTATLNGAN